MEQQTAGQAIATEFGLPRGSIFWGIIALLVDSEPQDKAMDFAAFPITSQTAADTLRRYLEQVDDMREFVGEQDFLREIERLINVKLSRILAAFDGNEPHPELHERFKDRAYLDAFIAEGRNNPNTVKET